MVRKISILLVIVALLGAFCTGAHATSYTTYDGNMNTSYITYFRDIVSGIGFADNYVAFRSGQNEYVMCVGDIDYAGNTFTLNGLGKLYILSNTDSYNSFYSYEVEETDSFILDPENKIVYSDLGAYPQLIDRGAKYEILTTVLLIIALLGFVFFRFFRMR